jgi:hypothetical protein
MSDLDEHRRRILSLYGRVNERAAGWRERVPLIAKAGFRILCGPPLVGKPMVVSENPAWSSNTKHTPGDCNYDFWPKRWPECMSYSTGRSRFARRICEVLEGAEIPIDEVNAGYVLVFRSKSIEQWEKEVRDYDDVRKDAQDLSLEILKEIIELLKPPFIYVAGFRAGGRMGCALDECVHRARRKSGREFVLLRSGAYHGKPVIASYHLSARLSRENREQIARELAGFKVSLVGPSKLAG